MKRAGSAAEVAALVAFLASDEAGYISGQVVSINGAMIAAPAPRPATSSSAFAGRGELAGLGRGRGLGLAVGARRVDVAVDFACGAPAWPAGSSWPDSPAAEVSALRASREVARSGGGRLGLRRAAQARRRQRPDLSAAAVSASRRPHVSPAWRPAPETARQAKRSGHGQRGH